ncbi:MAG: ATP-dependent Clp protease ATP-binding subunit [Candidatus Eremiobacteraeota bacterium]|nr:ATP-dependent Clp protease ATP-binding subunit [Candidatus Eremiobacteraeota bacterium]
MPLYLQGGSSQYTSVPLFWPELFSVQAPLLDKVVRLSQQNLRQSLEYSRKEPRLETFTRIGFCPDLREHFLHLKFEFERRTAQVRLLFVTFEALGQRVAYTPSLPSLWFPLQETGSLEEQAAEAVRVHLRQRKREGESIELEELNQAQRGWVHFATLDIDTPGLSEPPAPRSLFALLGGAPNRSGAEELAQCGRNLERRMEETPEVFLGRQRELEELALWRSSSQRGGLLLVGARLVGKSALIRAHVNQRLEAASKSQKKKKTKGSGTYQLSPGRLISGMSYVGQWENRFLSILKHCRKRDHVLVFDDLLGLLTAGVSSESSLNAAQLLKSFLDRSEVRVIGEMTPEAYQILRQRDRALADHFQVLFLDAPDSGQNRSIALAAARATEESQECSFSLEAVHQALQIGDRYLSDASHPGKVARLLQQVGAHFRKQPVGGQDLLRWFAEHSGMSLQLLDDRTTLEASSVAEQLRIQLVGQDEAVSSCAEQVALTKARLQSPGRPLGSLLFIGPTGVGKTECAKALANALFSSQERLIRIDMNEYLGEDSVARLIGTFHRPEGLLTEAVRSQPFSVLLLDEIEKAHPDVLLLLLQVLGDGRLTDARGRTVDFTQTIVIMTSNLGADQTRSSLGIRSRVAQEELTYRRAAEEFFPPELFNRIDRIVPFHRLDRPTVARIAERLWQKLLEREGLRRRQCLLEVDPQARELVIDAGFHPQLGARALKRTVEEKIVGPVARRLAALPPEGLTLIRVDQNLEVRVEPMSSAQTLAFELGQPKPAELASKMDELERQLRQGLAPESSVHTQESLRDSDLLYFELHEELRSLRTQLRPVTSPRTKARATPPPPLRQLAAEQIQELLSSLELQHQFEQWLQSEGDIEFAGLMLRINWLEQRLASPEDQQVLISLSGHGPSQRLLLKGYQEGFKGGELGCRIQGSQVELEGPMAQRVAEGECGLHLFVEAGGLHCVWVQMQTFQARLVRIYHGQRACLDVPSRLFCRKGWALGSLVLTR